MSTDHQGSFIALHDSGIDFRDYLDGEPIHNGDQLMLWVDDQWVWARYEVADFRRREAVLESLDRVRRLDRATMRVRWPSRTD